MAKKKEKIYVLDTSVLIHDHQAITNFENNHVAIPITVLEEKPSSHGDRESFSRYVFRADHCWVISKDFAVRN